MSKLKQLGRYQIIDEIGRGGMGIVYKGLDPKIERHVALKVIRLQDVADQLHLDELKERFYREARAAGKLSQHPNIVTIYDVGEDQDISYIAMEYVEGESLGARIKSGQGIPIKDALLFAKQVAEGLDYAHARGIVHRDIKPANIIICSTGMAKITDFGLARLQSAENLSKTGMAFGTPSYMSPEQIQSTNVDGRADLYSLGVIFYEMLTNERPFTGESMRSVMFKILRDSPVAPSSLNLQISPDIDAVVFKSMEKNLDDRFQTGKEFADAIEKIKTQPMRRSKESTADATLLSVPLQTNGSGENTVHVATKQISAVKPADKKPQKSLKELFGAIKTHPYFQQHFNKIIVGTAIFYVGLMALFFTFWSGNDGQEIVLEPEQPQIIASIPEPDEKAVPATEQPTEVTSTPELPDQATAEPETSTPVASIPEPPEKAIPAPESPKKPEPVVKPPAKVVSTPEPDKKVEPEPPVKPGPLEGQKAKKEAEPKKVKDEKVLLAKVETKATEQAKKTVKKEGAETLGQKQPTSKAKEPTKPQKSAAIPPKKVVKAAEPVQKKSTKKEEKVSVKEKTTPTKPKPMVSKPKPTSKSSGKKPSTVAKKTTAKPEKKVFLPPQGFKGTSKELWEASLEWKSHPDVDVQGYHLYRSFSPGGPFTEITNISSKLVTSFIDEELQKEQDKKSIVYYKISAYNSANEESKTSRAEVLLKGGIAMAPANFKAESGLPKKVMLTWDKHSNDDVFGYLIYRGDSPAKLEQIAKINNRSRTKYKNSGVFSKLKSGTPYYYAIAAYNKLNIEGPRTKIIIATTKHVPKQITGLKGSNKEVKRTQLSWDPSPEKDIREYIIERKEEDSESFHGEGSSSATSFLDEGLDDGKKYTYRVKAIDQNSLKGEYSKPVTIATKPLPTTPQNIRGMPLSSEIALAWKRSPEKDVREYNIYRKKFIGKEKIGTTSELTFTAENLKPDHDYTFFVTSVDADGLESKHSDGIKVKTMP